MTEPHDRGLLGPDSVAWRVIGHPVALVGGLRSLIVQSLHPLAMAGVARAQRLPAAARSTACGAPRSTWRRRRSGTPRPPHAAAERVRRGAREGPRHRSGDRPALQRRRPRDPGVGARRGVALVPGRLPHLRRRAQRRGPGPLPVRGRADRRAAGHARPRWCPRRGPSTASTSSPCARCCASPSRPATRSTSCCARRSPATCWRSRCPCAITSAAALATVPRDLRAMAGIDRPSLLDGVTVAAVRPAAAVIALPVLRDAPGAGARASHARAWAWRRDARLRDRRRPRLRAPTYARAIVLALLIACDRPWSRSRCSAAGAATTRSPPGSSTPGRS